MLLARTGALQPTAQFALERTKAVRLELPNLVTDTIEFEIASATSLQELAELLLAARDTAASRRLLKGLER